MNSWKCDCGKIFSSRKEMYTHYKGCEVHQQSIIDVKKVYKRVCPFCGEERITNKSGLSHHIKYCEKNPDHVICKGHKPSEETKRKTSESMKKAHAEGRAGMWPGRGKDNPSYPEKWVIRMLRNEFGYEEDKDYIRELPFHGFFLDFAWPISKFCIEIDGEQHQRFEEQKTRDKHKDQFLKEEGWTEVRADWQWIFHSPDHFVKLLKESMITKNSDRMNNESALYIQRRELEKKKKTEKKKEISVKKKANIEKRKLLEEQRNQKRLTAEAEGFLDKSGRLNSSLLGNEEIQRRKKLLEESGVDLMKYGWMGKAEKVTGLSKHQIQRIVEKTSLKCYKRK